MQINSINDCDAIIGAYYKGALPRMRVMLDEHHPLVHEIQTGVLMHEKDGIFFWYQATHKRLLVQANKDLALYEVPVGLDDCE